MKLHCSHDAFHGEYYAFNRLKQEICRVIGWSFPPHYLRNYKGEIAKDENGDYIIDKTLDASMMYFHCDIDEYSWLYEFLSHSDCDGEISPEMCKKLADELEPFINKLPKESFGHIFLYGGYKDVLRKFIAGCKKAAEANEPLLFNRQDT